MLQSVVGVDLLWLTVSGAVFYGDNDVTRVGNIRRFVFFEILRESVHPPRCYVARLLHKTCIKLRLLARFVAMDNLSEADESKIGITDQQRNSRQAHPTTRKMLTPNDNCYECYVADCYVILKQKRDFGPHMRDHHQGVPWDIAKMGASVPVKESRGMSR